MGDGGSITHSMVGKMDVLVADVKELRDHISDFDDFLRPLRNYAYWEPHCFLTSRCASRCGRCSTGSDGVDT